MVQQEVCQRCQQQWLGQLAISRCLNVFIVWPQGDFASLSCAAAKVAFLSTLGPPAGNKVAPRVTGPPVVPHGSLGKGSGKPTNLAKSFVLVSKVLTNSDTHGRIILPRVAVEANLSFLMGYRCALWKLAWVFLACNRAAPRPIQSGVRPIVIADRGPSDLQFNCMLASSSEAPWAVTCLSTCWPRIAV